MAASSTQIRQYSRARDPDNPVFVYGDRRDFDALAKYYLSENVDDATKTKNFRAYAETYQRIFKPGDKNARESLKARVPQGVSPLSYYYAITLGLLTKDPRAAGTIDYAANARIQTLLAEAKKYDVDDRALMDHVRTLQKNASERKAVYNTLRELLRENIEKKKALDVETNTLVVRDEPAQSSRLSVKISPDRRLEVDDYYTIIKWIGRNAKLLWTKEQSDHAQGILAAEPQGVYSEGDLDDLNDRIVMILSADAGSAFTFVRDVNTTARAATSQIVRDRAAISVIDASLRNREEDNRSNAASSSSLASSSSSSSRKRGPDEKTQELQSHSSLAPMIAVATSDIDRARQLVAENKWGVLRDLRDALNIDLAFQLQVRQQLYDVIDWPSLRTRELAHFGDIATLLRDLGSTVRSVSNYQETETSAIRRLQTNITEVDNTIRFSLKGEKKINSESVDSIIEKAKAIDAEPLDSATALATVNEEVQATQREYERAKKQTVSIRKELVPMQAENTDNTKARIDLSHIVSERKEEVRRQERVIRDVEHNNDDLKKAFLDLSAAQRELERARQHIAKQHATIASLQEYKDKATELEQTIADYEKSAQALRTHVSSNPELERRLAETLGLLKEAGQEIETARTDVVRLEERLQAANNTLIKNKSDKDRAAQLEATITRLETEKETFRQNAIELIKLVDAANQNIAELNRSVTDATNDVEDARRERDEFEEDLRVEREKIADHEKTIAELSLDRDALSKQLPALEASKVQLERQLQAETQKAINAENALKDLRNQSTASAQDLRTKQREVAASVQRIRAELDVKEADLVKLRADIKSNQDIAAAADNARRASETLVSNLEGQVRERDETIRNLEATRTSNIELLQEAGETIQVQAAELETARRRQAELEQQLESEQHLFDELEERATSTSAQQTAENEALTRERDDLRRQIAEAAAAPPITDLSEEHEKLLNDLAAEIKSLREKRDQAEVDRDDARKDNAEMKTQIDRLKAEIETLRKDETEFVDEDVVLSKKLKKLRAQYDELKALNDQEKAHRQEEVDRLVLQARDFERQYNEEEARNRELLSHLNKLEDDSLSARERLATLASTSSVSVPASSTSVVSYAPSPTDLVSVMREMISAGRMQAPSKTEETPVVLFDINAERERYRAIADQLSILNNSRAFEAMEDYILTSGDFDPSVFVVLDAFAQFVNYIEGATNSRKDSFWSSNSKASKSIIRDVIDAASTETEYSHALDLSDFTNVQPLVLTLVERTLRNYYLESASVRPEILFEPLKTSPPLRLRTADPDESFSRERLGALPTTYAHEKVFDADEHLKVDYDFLDMLRMYVLPVLNQPSRNIYFSLAVPTDDWTRKSTGTTLVGVAHELANGIMNHLHVYETGKKRRRPTRLSVRKFLSDILIADTTSRVQHAGIRYQNVNTKILSILNSVVANGFLSAFTFCLGKLKIPVDFRDELMYSALNNVDFRELVVLYYNLGVSRTQASRSQVSTTVAALQFSNKLDFFEDPANRIRPMVIPTNADVYTNAPQTRYDYIQQLLSSESPEYQAQRRRIQRIRRPSLAGLF